MLQNKYPKNDTEDVELSDNIQRDRLTLLKRSIKDKILSQPIYLQYSIFPDTSYAVSFSLYNLAEDLTNLCFDSALQCCYSVTYQQ